MESNLTEVLNSSDRHRYPTRNKMTQYNKNNNVYETLTPKKDLKKVSKISKHNRSRIVNSPNSPNSRLLVKKSSDSDLNFIKMKRQKLDKNEIYSQSIASTVSSKENDKMYKSQHRPKMIKNLLDLPAEMASKVMSNLCCRDKLEFSLCNKRIRQVYFCKDTWKFEYLNILKDLNTLDLSENEKNMLPTIISKKPVASEWFKRNYLLRTKNNLSLHRSKQETKAINNLYDHRIYGIKKMIVCENTIYILSYNNILWSMSGKKEDIANYELNNIDTSFMDDETRDECKILWKSFKQSVVDATTDTRRGPEERRYLYVLSQSEELKNIYQQHKNNIKCNIKNRHEKNLKTWSNEGFALAGDRIDVYDEKNGNRIFNMSFDVDMRFTCIRLCKSENKNYQRRNHILNIDDNKQRLLTVLCIEGRVFCLHVDETELADLGHEGLQVTLSRITDLERDGTIKKLSTGTNMISLINTSGDLFIYCQRKTDLTNLFGTRRATALEICTPIKINFADDKTRNIKSCSVGLNHVAFIDEDNCTYVMGKNRNGQLGLRNKLDSYYPKEVLEDKYVRFITCGDTQTIACIELKNDQNLLSGVELLGCGNAQDGRLPGISPNSEESSIFTKLEVNRLDINLRQIDLTKGCIYLMANYDEDDEFSKLYSNYKLKIINSIQNCHDLDKFQLTDLIKNITEFPKRFSDKLKFSLLKQLVLKIDKSDDNNLIIQAINSIEDSEC